MNRQPWPWAKFLPAEWRVDAAVSDQGIIPFVDCPLDEWFALTDAPDREDGVHTVLRKHLCPRDMPYAVHLPTRLDVSGETPEEVMAYYTSVLDRRYGRG